MPSPDVAILTLGLIGVGYGLISGVTAGAVASYWPKDLARFKSTCQRAAETVLLLAGVPICSIFAASCASVAMVSLPKRLAVATASPMPVLLRSARADWCAPASTGSSDPKLALRLMLSAAFA